MNPLFRIDFSISDSLKIVRKSVLIYETIINWTLCVKSEKLKTIQIKKSQQKRSCQIDFTQFSKTFSIGFSWIYLITSDEK